MEKNSNAKSCEITLYRNVVDRFKLGAPMQLQTHCRGNPFITYPKDQSCFELL